MTVYYTIFKILFYLYLSFAIYSIFAQGDKEDLERFSKTLNLPERGKVYVKGIFDNTEPQT